MNAREARRRRREAGEYSTTGAVSRGSLQDQKEAKRLTDAAREAAGVPGEINQTIEGKRFSKTKNKNVKCDMAVNAIARNAPIGKHGEYVRPICEWPSAEEFPLTMWDSPDLKGFNGRKSKLQQMIKANLIKQEDAGAGEYQLSFASKCGIAMDRAFACLPSTTSVIVLTSGGGFEHAMLLFINGTNIWSCGYGFYGSADTRDAAWHENFAILLKDWIPCTKGKSESEQDAIAHKLETLQGALYTSDYLLPNYTQAANMVWVGFLDDGIKNRLEKYLDAVKIIQIKTTGKGRNLTATNHMTLYVGDSYYQEAAGWTGRDLQGRIKMNCLKWVKHILGQDLKCGVLGEPSNCKKVNEEQWARLIDSNFLAGARESVAVVEAVQNELLRPDIPSTVGKGLQKLTQNPWIPTMLCGIGIGAACAPAAIGPTGCGALTGAACVGARAIAHGKVAKKMSTNPIPHNMTRTPGNFKKNPGGGGRKTRRKRKKRRTRNKHKRRKKKRRRTRYKKKKHRRKRRTRR